MEKSCWYCVEQKTIHFFVTGGKLTLGQEGCSWHTLCRNDILERVMGADPSAVGNRIKFIREAMGITQAELAARIGVSRKRMGEYESGSAKRKLREYGFLERIAAALSVPGCTISIEMLLYVEE